MSENIKYFSKRLLKSLEAMLRSPLTMVEAPAGYGKTVAVDEFLRKYPDNIVVTATAKETAPESFWPDFCRTLAQSIPKAADAVSALAKLGLPHDFVQIKAALDLLRQVAFTKKTFMVFDDCHFLPRSFISFCESLAAETMSNLHVVCITRHSLTSHKELLRPQKALLSCIDRKAFALTPPEICEYFARYDVSLSREEAHVLHTSTEGWISALYLSLLLYKKNGNTLSFTSDIAARMKETIQKTVYAPLSAEAKDLLFALTPLERFTGEQASRLYGKGAAALLEELTSKNTFVAYDQKSRIYSFHDIFRQFLMQLFENKNILTDKRRRDIYRACGEVLMDAGELASAMDAWHKAGDFERALAVLESDMSRNLVSERASLYTAIFKDCPEEILERHIYASFKYVLAAFCAEDFQVFSAQLALLAQRCIALPPGKSRDHWRGELEVLLSLSKYNDIEAMSAHHRKALALLKGPTSLYGQDSPWALGSPSVLFMFYRESGNLEDALRQLRECMPHYYELASNCGAGAEFLMEAESLYNAGNFAKAQECCQTALERAVLHNQLGNIFCAQFLFLRLALLEGNAKALFGDEEHEGFVANMRGMITRSRDFFLLHTVDLCEGWLYAALGLYDKIPFWLRVKLSEDSPLYIFAKGYYYIVRGRALLLNGAYAELVELFSGMLNAGAFHKNLLFSVYAHIYLAAALEKMDRNQEAAAALNFALDTALPDALYMPFVENHDFIGPLLAKILSSKSRQTDLVRIEALAKRMNESCKSVLLEIQAPNLPTLLSDRQWEIALLVGKGLSNTEIAEKLNIKDATVKAHLTSVYENTGTSNRVGLRKILKKFLSNNGLHL